MEKDELITRNFTKLPNDRVKCDQSCEIGGVFKNLVKSSDGRNVCVTNEDQGLTRGLGVNLMFNIPCLRGICALYEEKREEEQK